MQQKGLAAAETGYTLTRRSVVCLHGGRNLQHAIPKPIASFGDRSTVRRNDSPVERLTLFSLRLFRGARASKEWPWRIRRNYCLWLGRLRQKRHWRATHAQAERLRPPLL